MKASELRIGNYVYYHDEEIEKVKAIWYDNTSECYLITTNLETKDASYIHVFSPIPLTEDWLLKLGFEYYEPLNHYRIVINDVWYSVSKDMFFTFVNLNYDETKEMPRKKIEYVHQLQNLYWCLCGKELTLKD